MVRRTTRPTSGSRHAVAIGLVGGLFDLIADWLLDADLQSADQLESLIDDMTTFYIMVRRGLGTR